MERLSISSKTITKLKLSHGTALQRLDIVMLRLPFLEVLHLESVYVEQLPSRFQGEVPLLKRAVLILTSLHKKCCTAVPALIKEHMFKDNPFPILLEPGKKVPNFPNLKHLEATMCFHDHNFEAVVSMLHHSPALPFNH